MPQPTILSIGTAVPEHRFEQMDIYHGLANAINNRRAPAIFEITEVESRHLVHESLDWYAQNPGNGARMKSYMTHAVPLGIRAVQQALDNAGLSPQDIDSFIVTSCTGVDTPGPDVKIAEALDMSPYLRRLTIVGMGCQALVPSLHQAGYAVQLNPQFRVLVLTLELCTLHIQHSRRVKNIIGTALFADGASAAVISNGHSPGPKLLDTLSFSDYQTQEEISFHPGDTGYQIYLSGRIPDLIGQKLPSLVDRVLVANQLQLSQIKHWAVHPGGMKILDSVEETLDLDSSQLQQSRSILREFGNMSSATLLFVLQRIIKEKKPSAGDYGLLVGFGPGLSIEVGLVQW